MRIDISKQILHILVHRLNHSLIFGFAMLGINVLLTLIVFNGKERVVVVPPVLATSIWTERQTVSQSYLEEMAIFFAKQILDITPSTASFQREHLLRYVNPSFYNALRKKMLDEEQKYEKDNLSMSFRPLSAVVDVKALQVTLTGLLQQYVGNKFVQQTKEVYEMQFSYEAGQLLIKSFVFKKQEEA